MVVVVVTDKSQQKLEYLKSMETTQIVKKVNEIVLEENQEKKEELLDDIGSESSEEIEVQSDSSESEPEEIDDDQEEGPVRVLKRREIPIGPNSTAHVVNPNFF